MEIITRVGEFLGGAQVSFVYWCMAIFGTVFFLIMSALSFFAGVGDHDVDSGDGDIAAHTDTGYADFKLLSVRSALAFTTFFGWGGVIWGQFGWAGFFGSLASGFAMMFAVSALLFMLLRMQHSGNVSASDYMGAVGKVYVGIPGGRSNPGKVTVTLGGSSREIQAVADEEIPTGYSVVILESLDGSKFLVKKS